MTRAHRVPVCGDRRPGQEPCGETRGLVRLFVGVRCSVHTPPGAQVYEAYPDPDPVDDQADVLPAARAPRVVTPATGGQLPDPSRAAASTHMGSAGSEAQAAELVMGRTGKPRRRLLERFIELGDQGMTSWEAWQWYQREHGRVDLYTLRPRLTELKKDGWLIDSGRRRHPRGQGDGVPAEEVLVLSPRGRIQAGAQ